MPRLLTRIPPEPSPHDPLGLRLRAKKAGSATDAQRVQRIMRALPPATRHRPPGWSPRRTGLAAAALLALLLVPALRLAHVSDPERPTPIAREVADAETSAGWTFDLLAHDLGVPMESELEFLRIDLLRSADSLAEAMQPLVGLASAN